MTLDKAMKSDSLGEFSSSASVYKNLYSQERDKSKKAELAYRAAEAYRMSGDVKNAAKWYDYASKQGNKDPKLLYRVAQMQLAQGQYQDAIVKLNDYKKANPSDSMGDFMYNNASNALKWSKEKSKYSVENAKALNTRWYDFAPSYYKKDEIVFTSDREGGINKDIYIWDGMPFTDMWSSKINKKTGSFAPPAIFGAKELNTDYNDGSCQFDKKGNIYFTQCNGKKGKEKNCKIYSCEMKGKNWETPEALPFQDSVHHYSHPCVSTDGTVLYFTSDMEGGLGGYDIWFTVYNKKSKTWGDPINAGPVVNTSKDEVYPWLHSDGTLFFASNGHQGMGGMDIFQTKGQGKDWEMPKNMKAPINSGADDFALICDDRKETGFFTSNRPGGRGADDIYSFKIQPMQICLQGKVVDCRTGEALANATITISNSLDDKKLVLKTDAQGKYKTKCDLKANAEYSLFAQKREDYYLDSKTEEVSTFGIEVSTTLVQDFCLKQINLDAIFNVRGIYYDLDSARIRPDAAKILDSLVLVLTNYPKITIELGSHTDCRASYEYNINLSQRRADSAVAYVISRGIESDRLTAKGYGETQLVNDCACERDQEPFVSCTEDEHQLNRRTTVKITGKGYVSKTKPAEPPAPPKKPAPNPRNKPK